MDGLDSTSTVVFTPIASTIGGLLIGTSAALVLLGNGKLAGISGIVARSWLRVPGDTTWRVLFLVGLVAGGALGVLVVPGADGFASDASAARVLAAGFLVGLGTRLGGGCTSGHGVCGLARGSRPSLVAVLVFLGVAMLTVWVLFHGPGSGAAAGGSS